jgi:putative ABC transport system permease protein
MRALPLIEASRHAMQSVRSDLGRALGVILGVAIATGALTMLSAVAESGEHAIAAATGGDGAVILEGVPILPALGETLSGNARSVDTQDLTILRKSTELSEARVGARRATMAFATWRGQGEMMRVLGISADVPAMLGFRAKRGRMFSAADGVNGARSVVLGAKLVERLPGPAPEVGKTLSLNGISFLIIGIMNDAPSFSSGDPWDWDNSVLTTDSAFAMNLVRDRLGSVDRIFLAIGTNLSSNAPRFARIVRTLVGFRHGGDRVLRVDAGADRTKRLEMMLEITGALLLVTALVSLFVSSLNVMNCTLISATERAYEIGLRRSLGASQSDVFWQFVVEALVLAVIGATIGLLGGAALIAVATALIRMALPAWELRVSAGGLMIAIGLPIVLSAAFTAYPAWRAARLDAATALRRSA